MITLAQRIEELRNERNLSRPALAAALNFPKTSIEKFETGRQTPSQEQQKKMSSFFGVSDFYLRGETNDRTQMDDWMDGAFMDVAPAPVPSVAKRPAPVPVASDGGQSTVFDSFLGSKKFQDCLHTAVLDALRSPEGQEILEKAIRRQQRK